MYPSIALHRWAVETRKPYIVTVNGMLEAWALENSGWKKRIAALLYERRNLEAAACLQANTRSEFESIRAFGLRNPIAIIPNGVPLPAAERRDANSDSSDSDGSLASAPLGHKTLLFLGRIHPKKGLAELVEGWELSRARINGWKLEISGWDDGQHEAALRERIVRLGVDDSVTWTGALFGKAKDRALRRASAFILPSFSEGLPIAPLEAWAYGKPVLITPQCNIPEGFSAGAAIQIEPDSDSIARGLDRLTMLTSAELHEMGSRGRQLVKEQFAWPRIAEEMKTVYEWILGHGPRPACVVET